ELLAPGTIEPRQGSVVQTYSSWDIEPSMYDKEHLQSLLQGSLKPRDHPAPAQCMR
ncbi:hypothetical protein BGZ83_003736, partial [Gryganskiella cystojenkinii]